MHSEMLDDGSCALNPSRAMDQGGTSIRLKPGDRREEGPIRDGLVVGAWQMGYIKAVLLVVYEQPTGELPVVIKLFGVQKAKDPLYAERSDGLNPEVNGRSRDILGINPLGKSARPGGGEQSARKNASDHDPLKPNLEEMANR